MCTKSKVCSPRLGFRFCRVVRLGKGGDRVRKA